MVGVKGGLTGPVIKVRNTMGRRLEIFEPFNPPLVRMYVCGPTPYDYTHIGHARTFVAFDGIKRYLELRGYSVLHIQNITDIDDKIINKSRETGEDWRSIADKYARDYLEAMSRLRVNITIHPKVTEHIIDIIEFVKKLVEKGYAYVAKSGSVYFNVDKYPGYGSLSGRRDKQYWNQEEHVTEKLHPYDFALWKAAKPGEPFWESPWGRGRPGWHIECSVMSTKYAGGKLDIHGGASDLIFPHHENERAQSEAYLGEAPWVKYWLHTGYLTIEGEKMSKSLGNIILLRDALNKWGENTLRAWLLSAHYRAQIEYSEQSLKQAQRFVERFRSMIQGLAKLLENPEPSHKLGIEEVQVLREIENITANWHREMSSDFNFSGALREAQKLVNLYYSKIRDNSPTALVLEAYKTALQINKVLAVADDIVHGASSKGLEAKLIELIVEIRSELRRRKEYTLADTIRDKLGELGIILMDYKDRTEWRIK